LTHQPHSVLFVIICWA